MQKFLPRSYANFKRIANYLKKNRGLAHSQALTMLSQACGFEDFHAVGVIFRPDQRKPKPTAIQCAGELGYETCCAQLVAVVGHESVVNDWSQLRDWYRHVFEVPGVDAPASPPSPTQDRSPSQQKVDSKDELPAKTDSDPGGPPIASACAPVVVTYRRRCLDRDGDSIAKARDSGC